MSRTPKRIISGKVYELCFRVREGLPFPPTLTIKAIIDGIMARAQRDSKVVICHYIWMSNHVHIIIVAKDAEQCIKFYMEIEKKLTDSIKKLINVRRLNLWEGDPSVNLIPDLDTVAARIAYLYANPSEADLESSIDQYCGTSSWNEFSKSDGTLDYKSSKSTPWIRIRNMEALPHRVLSNHQDKFFANKFKSSAKKIHILSVEPNAWMKCFQVTEVEEINNRIRFSVRLREKLSSERRAKIGKSVMGSHRLVSEPILKAHTPKKKSNKIFVICHDKELRIACIAEHKDALADRKEIYLQWKAGDFSRSWPPGFYRPSMPPLANAVQFFY